MNGYIFNLPATFGVATGKAVWISHFKLWQAVPTNMLYPLVTEIRKRKGLSPEPPNQADRSEERRVGKEGSSGWSAYHSTKRKPRSECQETRSLEHPRHRIDLHSKT